MKAISLVYITFSRIFEKTNSREWVYNFGYFLYPPFLSKRFTITSFSLSGKIPDSIEALHTLVRGFFINFMHSSAIKSGTSSIPAESLPLRSFITFSTLSPETGTMNIVCGHVLNCNFLLPLYYPTPRWLKMYNGTQYFSGKKRRDLQSYPLTKVALQYSYTAKRPQMSYSITHTP